MAGNIAESTTDAKERDAGKTDGQVDLWDAAEGIDGK